MSILERFIARDRQRAEFLGAETRKVDVQSFSASRPDAAYRSSDRHDIEPASSHDDLLSWRPEALEDRRKCANPACSRGWSGHRSEGRRPVFEQKWGCGPRCLKAIVGAAVRRELGEGMTVENKGQHLHRIPLGLILLARGWITHEQLKNALDVQKGAGGRRIGRCLMEECGLREEFVTRALSLQWSCPVLPMQGFKPEAMAMAIPRILVEQLGLLPLRIAADRILYLAFEDQMDASAAFAMERMSGLRVESGLVDGTQLKLARERLLQCEFIDATLERLPDVEAISAKMAAELRQIQPRASRLVRIHHFYWFRMWRESGAMRGANGGIPVSKEDVVDHLYTIGSEA